MTLFWLSDEDDEDSWRGRGTTWSPSGMLRATALRISNASRRCRDSSLGSLACGLFCRKSLLANVYWLGVRRTAGVKFGFGSTACVFALTSRGELSSMCVSGARLVTLVIGL